MAEQADHDLAERVTPGPPVVVYGTATLHACAPEPEDADARD